MDECATFRFDLDCSPVRRLPNFTGQSNYPGLWWFATTGQHVGHESWLERDHLMLLDADPDVVGAASQPFRFHWLDSTHHVPDYFARNADGGATVIDVRADDRISPDDQRRFVLSEIACKAVGWRYRRVGVPGQVVVANFRWLSGYRHGRVCRDDVADALVTAFAEPAALISGAREVGDPVHVLPVLFHLLWHQQLVADLAGALLSEMTVVSPAPQCGLP
ncbi:TnsA-like heteromeric transposase endonuclease subunit [Mycobacteroides chelonae]|nr:TnsA-like heteromeric transposase endonuclease subunit [Mycobacteroides chelonae]MBV6361076.1 TnsA-like heteromeric transposase endonuclease subunit [Mycobacteroides chelonae]UJW68291.1 TnsA-like heteromeric transposase endonuclease subunit [Mycobacteroides chelonae]UJW68400.1 TnsA-like heteromeric transposase endonuclease subunit [Mycobacteroides chelonae]